MDSGVPPLTPRLAIPAAHTHTHTQPTNQYSDLSAFVFGKLFAAKQKERHIHRQNGQTDENKKQQLLTQKKERKKKS